MAEKQDTATFIIKEIILGYVFEDFVWSLTWWGSIYENWKQKSVRGFSLDFALFNLTGFALLSLNYGFGYFDEIQADLVGKVSIADLVFAFYGFFLSCLNFTQIYIYPRGSQKFTKLSVIVHVALLIAFLLALILTVWTDVVTPSKYFSLVGICGDFKIIITLVKYIPQVYLNYKRKSTQGWSIIYTLADAGGSTASLVVNIWDIIISTSNFNAAKFFLGLFSLFFDVILLLQHYVFYKDKIPLSQRGSEVIIRDIDEKLIKDIDEETIEGSSHNNHVNNY